ncbi:hypothetical protein KGO95_02985 [Patescibacteria group bacterium]|nr:hypothetical protein [Patescibacteria group bacterium]
MEIPFITTITLVWLIYTFIFVDADKQILDLFNRLKFSLSVNEGRIDKTQLDVKMQLGILEISDLGKTFNQNDPYRKNIEIFERKVGDVDLVKKILMINLFLLTIHPFFRFFDCFLNLETHLIISLIAVAPFYWYIQGIQKIRFSQIISKSVENN